MTDPTQALVPFLARDWRWSPAVKTATPLERDGLRRTATLLRDPSIELAFSSDVLHLPNGSTDGWQVQNIGASTLIFSINGIFRKRSSHPGIDLQTALTDQDMLAKRLHLVQQYLIKSSAPPGRYGWNIANNSVFSVDSHFFFRVLPSLLAMPSELYETALILNRVPDHPHSNLPRFWVQSGSPSIAFMHTPPESAHAWLAYERDLRNPIGPSKPWAW